MKMKMIMTKITSLFAEKKAKIVAGVLAVAVIAGGTFAVISPASAESAWAVFLTFFGKGNVTGNVWQSVLLDGGRYWQGDDKRVQEHPMDAIFSGDTFVSSHTLENRSPVDQKVILSTSYYPEKIADGITTKYYKLLEYTADLTTTGGFTGLVTVEDLGEWIEWTFDVIGDRTPTGADLASGGSFMYNLVISLDGKTPAFIVHNNDGIDSNYDWEPISTVNMMEDGRYLQQIQR